MDAIQDNDWNKAFQGNRTHLKIVGLEKLQLAGGSAANDHIVRRRSIRLLTGITRLTATSSPHNNERDNGMHDSFAYLSFLFLYLKELDLDSYKISGGKEVLAVYFCFVMGCPNLTHISWNNFNGSYFLEGNNFADRSSLTSLSLDDCRFHASGDRRSDATFE